MAAAGGDDSIGFPVVSWVYGGDNPRGELFSYLDLQARVRRDHRLRAIDGLRPRRLATFGSIKMAAGQEKTGFGDRNCVGPAFIFAAADNLVRPPKLMTEAD